MKPKYEHLLLKGIGSREEGVVFPGRSWQLELIFLQRKCVFSVFSFLCLDLFSQQSS